jgi:formiminotetrahydrofolate cyclodeaminase
MRDWTLSQFLEQLASRQPAPGGGAAAALHAAQAAALVGMVARCSQGPKYAEHKKLVSRITADADRLREESLKLAEDDAGAFTAVADGYKLPRDTPEQRAWRNATIAAALVAAAEPPAEVITTTERIIALAEKLLPAANPNALADLSAAAQTASAAAHISGLNLESNLSAHLGPNPKHLSAALSKSQSAIQRADQLIADIRKEIGE